MCVVRLQAIVCVRRARERRPGTSLLLEWQRNGGALEGVAEPGAAN